MQKYDTFFLQKHLFREELPLFRFCRKIISGTSAVIARSSWECLRRNTERVCNRNNRFIWLQTSNILIFSQGF